MGAIFISHASADLEKALGLKTWLEQQGLDSIFLDADSHSGIQPGAAWERTLYRALERCEAVLLMLTPAWLDSKWCFAEFVQARALGKSIFPVIFTPLGERVVAQDIQYIDLTREREGGLERLGHALQAATMSSRAGFHWDTKRPPYPGLMSFEAEDAAVFFGRDEEIRQLIENISARRNRGQSRLIAVLGSSGSGKSSLLRAGVLPRLELDRKNWIVLPVFRPGSRPTERLLDALTVTLAGEGALPRPGEAQSHDRVRYLEMADRHLASIKRPEARIVIPIDQGEELYTVTSKDELHRFFDTLRGLITGDSPFIVVCTLRSEFLGHLQSAHQLDGLVEEFSLRPMPVSRIPDIIKGPARVAGIDIEEALVQTIVQDTPTSDVLPLVAFALRELYDRTGKGRQLTAQMYAMLGSEADGVSPLENAVRLAADECIRVSQPTADELAALREAFIPSLVKVGHGNAYVRQQARWDELPGAAHRLLRNLVDARLLVTGHDGKHAIIEVAHESLLRKWPRLRTWIEQDQGFLAWLDDVSRMQMAHSKVAARFRGRALLTGFQLDQAHHWAPRQTGRLAPRVAEYVERSLLERYYRRLLLVVLGLLVIPTMMASVMDGYITLYFRDFNWARRLASEAIVTMPNMLKFFDILAITAMVALLMATSCRWVRKRWGARGDSTDA